MWSTILGAITSARIGDHVSFNLIYVRLSEKWRAVMDIVGCALILAAMVLLILPSADYLDFIRIKRTPVLRINFGVLYAPFILFLIYTIIYIARNMFNAVCVLTGRKKQDQPAAGSGGAQD
jgi:C4-dicarboxylate transporter DctQ subunit